MTKPEMSSYDRVMSAIGHQEADRVPLFLLLSTYGAKELQMPIKEYFSSARNVVEAQLRMREKYQNDCLNSFFYAPLEIEAWGGEVIFAEDGPPNSGDPIIKHIQQISSLEVPRINESPCLLKVLDTTEQLKQTAGNTTPIIGVVMSPFSLPVMQMGFEKYLQVIYFQKDDFARLMRKNIKVLELFKIVFGAQTCRYLDISENSFDLDQNITDLIADPDKDYILLKDQQEIYIKIGLQSEIYGFIMAGNFLFPQYIDKYSNFAISICRVGALALSNANKYEKLVKSKDEMTFMSYHDSLTGLYNRTYFNKSMEKHAQASSLAIFVCDIDKLKYVNDTFGHIEGDNLICMAANALKHCFRESDVVARIGGDEFVVIVPECNTVLAEMLKSRINEMVEKQNENCPDKHYKLSLSVGYAVKENESTDIEELFHSADVEMYNEKLQKKQNISPA